MNPASITGQSFDWLKTYRVKARRYDELRDDQKQVRPHWAPLLNHLQRHGQEGAAHNVVLTRNLIAENGVTYNVYADPKGADRPWTLDALPLIVTHDEWRVIEQGVQQRARVLNALLTDLYGPQRLLAEGLVPPELAFGHPNFLWPCRGVTQPGNRWLSVYAVDLARAPDGSWWVLSDRTQTPSGAGYALENRQITSRIYADVFRQSGIEPVHSFFVALREQLLSDIEDDAPLAVVLTPGAFNETYFEHAYLARQLGMLLVEGHDLTVRGDTLYLKTLKGLKRVHAILRRLDDDYCDPVELRSDSALGVPGLLQVIRAGRVVLANPLGSGVLQSAGWMGFLPGIAEWLLDEMLSLPSVATWWCGERPALDYVIKHVDRLVIKPTFPNQRYQVNFGDELQPSQRDELFARMRRNPHAYVAQEKFALSQVPVWHERSNGHLSLSAKAMTLRVYAVANGDGYRVLPGGLARIAGETSADRVSSQLGGGSKDVWVLTDTAETSARVGIEARVLRPSVRHSELPSSTGENLFWLGRYNERLENKVRLLRSSLAMRTQPEVWQSALAACRLFGLQAGEVELTESMLAVNNPNSINADYKRMSWCATQVRSRLSLEHWRTLNLLRRQLRDVSGSKQEPRESLDWMLLSLAALSGFALDDLQQDEGWRLLRLGRRLERTQFLCDLLTERLQSGVLPSQAELEWWLELNGSIVSYRSRYVTSPRLSLTLDLLLRDTANPRALAYQRDTVHADLLHLADMFDAKLESQLGVAIAAVLDGDFGVLEGQGQGASYARQSLSATLGGVSNAVRRLSDDLSLLYFSHVERALQMMEI
jgi:uncharacterized circularly permuted ATP-grasp superfamily protein/uncharacterized alpha-E superfamily protein